VARAALGVPPSAAALAAAAAAAARPQRRARTPHAAPDDREGDFIHPDDRPRAVVRTAAGERRAYPGVARSWAAACARAQAAAAAAAPRKPPPPGAPRGTLPTPYPLLSTRIEDVGSLGEGVVLYFTWLAWLARLFFLCGVLATPACVFHALSQRRFHVFSDRQDAFAQLTLGTQQTTNAADAAASASSSSSSAQMTTISTGEVYYFGYRKESLLLACSLLDVAYVALFLLVVTLLRVSQRRVAKRARAETLTIGRFTVLVRGLPAAPASGAYATAVRRHFEAAYGRGAVAEVALATACGDMLRLFRRRGAALASRRAAAAAVNRSRGASSSAVRAAAAAAAAVRAADDAIEGAFARDGASSLSVVAAFVTFDSASIRDRALAEHASLRGRLFPPRRLRFPLERSVSGRRVALEVTPAPEPSNVLWSHLEYGRFAQALRSGVTNCATVCLMVASFAIIIAAESLSEALPPNVSEADTRAAGALSCATLWPTLAAATANSDPARVAVAALAAHASAATCAPLVGNGVFLGYGAGGGTFPPFSPLTPSGLLSNASAWSRPGGAGNNAYACGALLCAQWRCEELGVAAWARDVDGARAFCGGYWRSEFRTTALLVASSGVVVAVNLLFRALITALTAFEKHHTVSAAEAAIAFKFFLSTVINTSLIFLIVYGAIQARARVRCVRACAWRALCADVAHIRALLECRAFRAAC
jgi:hypothetical protein